MCFYTNSQCPNELIATSDIVCYKVVRQKYFLGFILILYESLCQYKIYIQNKLYKHKKPLIVENNRIYEGFHSYININKAIIAELRISTVIVRCIIPRGAKYYINVETNEYLSNQIKLKNTVKYEQNN